MKSKTILITGGASGLGMALVKDLHENNRIIICGRDNEKLLECKSEFPSIMTIKADISEKRDLENLVEILRGKFGVLDVLINNAGVANFFKVSELEKTSLVDMDINFKGTVNTTFGLIPLLKKSNAPKVVIVSSILAKVPHYDMPIYSASKAALHSFAITLRANFKEIHVLEALPPLIDTKMTEDLKGAKKMSPDAVSMLIIQGMLNGKKEVYPGISKLANIMSKVNFKKILKIINA